MLLTRRRLPQRDGGVVLRRTSGPERAGRAAAGLHRCRAAPCASRPGRRPGAEGFGCRWRPQAAAGAAGEVNPAGPGRQADAGGLGAGAGAGRGGAGAEKASADILVRVCAPAAGAGDQEEL